jgi:hypothetical protein
MKRRTFLGSAALAATGSALAGESVKENRTGASAPSVGVTAALAASSATPVPRINAVSVRKHLSNLGAIVI